jgi:uncharacterized protein YndB with AHSA1/START domain
MKIALLIVGALIAIVALMALVGALLPREHVATRTATFRQPPEKLFAAARDFAAFPTWRPDVKSVELLPPEGGVVGFREVSRHGPVTYRVKEERVGERLVLEIADEHLPYGGTWTYEFTPAGRAAAGEMSGGRAVGGSVRITERGFVKPALFRFLARFVFGYTATMEGYLRALGKKFGEEVTPASAKTHGST